MTIPITADHLRREIDHARAKLLTRVKKVQDEIVSGFAGLLTMDAKDAGHRRLIENHYYEYISYVLPRIISNDPKVRVKSTRAGQGKAIAAANEAGVNQWIVDSKHRWLCQRVCTDFLTGWGGVLLRLDHASGATDDDDDPRLWPVAEHLDRASMWWDISANSFETKRFSGYSYAIDLEELIEKSRTEAGWDRGIVRDLPVDAGLDEIGRDQHTPRRREVVLREIWVPDYQLPNAPEHSNGTIFTLAVAGTSSKPLGVFPRAPKPFFGPSWGPIYLYDAYYIPGQSLGMSPCEAVIEQVNELNRHAEALSRATARRKRIGVGDARYERNVDTLRTAIDGDFVLIDGFDKQHMIDMELGGATSEQRQAILELRERLQRTSGLSDAMRGAVTGIGSPTENAIASEASGTRIGHLVQRFADCDERVLQGVMWYLMHTRAMRVNVSGQALGFTEDQDVEVAIQGGPDGGFTFDDFSLNIERYTMERQSEAVMQRRVVGMLQAAMPLIQAAPQIASYADVTQLLDTVGESFGRPNLGKLINADEAVKMLGVQHAMAIDPGEQTVEGATTLPRPDQRVRQEASENAA